MEMADNTSPIEVDDHEEAVTGNKSYNKHFKVAVIYNGVSERFNVRPDELVKSLLEKAIKKFGSIPNPHTLSLFNDAGEELDDNKTLEAAGVKPHDNLLLRPSTVKGGK